MRQYVVTVKYEIETADDITEDDVLDDWTEFTDSFSLASVTVDEQ